MDQSIFSLRRTFDEKKPQTLREGPLPPDRQVPRSRAQCMQFQLTNKPQNGSNSSRVLQPEGLRRLPPYAIDFKSAERCQIYRQQHGEITSFSVEGLRFIDRYNFLQGRLHSLVEATPKEALKLTSSISKGSEPLFNKGI